MTNLIFFWYKWKNFKMQSLILKIYYDPVEKYNFDG